MTMSKYIIQIREVMLSNLLARAMTCHYYINDYVIPYVLALVHTL